MKGKYKRVGVISTLYLKSVEYKFILGNLEGNKSVWNLFLGYGKIL